jgi:hypothetical protein
MNRSSCDPESRVSWKGRIYVLTKNGGRKERNMAKKKAEKFTCKKMS